MRGSELTDGMFEKGRALSAGRQNPAHGRGKPTHGGKGPSKRGPISAPEHDATNEPKDVKMTTAEILDFSQGADS